MQDFGRISSFIWGTADLIRDSFRRGHYQDVILPMTVLRRLDCVLAPTHEKVVARYRELKGKIDKLDRPLCRASGYAFYNISDFTFERLLAAPGDLKINFTAWLNGFSDNMREVLEKFDFRNTLDKLDEADLLYLVVQRFGEVDLHPRVVDNHTMGLIFEDLIQRFNEALDENPGEHFTPRDVVRLMARLMIEPDRAEIRRGHKTMTVCDPCCGTGGMLTVAKELIEEISDTADVHLFGQEVNPQTFAVTKSDLFLSTAKGEEAENIFFGSSLSNDLHLGRRFDYLLANPPYGKDWKRDKDAVEEEHALGEGGRFAPGLPRISDGQTLFLLHMVHHMKDADAGGARVLIIMNGSPLFTGDASSGESEIRRWLMERDLVEAIVAMPEQLFYNTGIATYVWVLSNRKPRRRRGKVQLINASGEAFWQPMRKSLGDKRREIAPEQADAIVRLYDRFEEDEHGISKIFDSTAFGYRKITVSARSICDQLWISANGVTRFGIGKGRLSETLIPAPDSNEQRTIAAFLDRETTKIDTLIQKKQRLIELLNEKRTALISHAVTKGLDPGVPMRASGVEWIGDVPSHWRVMSLKRTAKPFGKAFTDGDWVELPFIEVDGIRLVQTGNVGVGEYKEKGFRYISEKTFHQLGCTEVDPGDILICRLDGPVGRACLAPALGVRMITSVDNAILKYNAAEHDGRFLVYFMSSRGWLMWIHAICRAGGGFRFRISRSMVGELPMALPPLDEQCAISDVLHASSMKMRDVMTTALRAIERLQEYRAALISAAVTGQIDVRNEV